MARRRFGADLSAVAWRPVTVDGTDNLAQVAALATGITAWTAEQVGTQVTDLLDSDGVAIPAGVITADDYGRIDFFGPDTTPETALLWLDTGLPSRQAITAADLAPQVVALAGDVADAQAVLDAGSDLLVFDDFTRPASDTVGVALTGQSWTEHTGDADIASDRLTATGSTAATLDAGTANIDATLLVTHTGGAPGMVFRSVAGTSDRLQAQLDATNGLRLQKVAAGVTTLLVGQAMAFVTNGTRTYALRVVAYDDAIRVYLDGVLVLAHTLSAAEQTAYGALTRLGVLTTSGGTFDDLRAEAAARLEDVTPIRRISGDYTLAAADAGRTIEQSTATTATLTVPPGVLPPGTAAYLVLMGSGTWTVAAGAGMTVRGAGSVGAQYAGRTLYASTLTEAVLL